MAPPSAQVVYTPIGTDGRLMERAIQAAKDGGGAPDACVLPDIPDMHAAALITVESHGQRISYLKRGHESVPRLLAGGKPM